MQWTSDCTKALASTKERGDKKALKSLKKKQVRISCSCYNFCYAAFVVICCHVVLHFRLLLPFCQSSNILNLVNPSSLSIIRIINTNLLTQISMLNKFSEMIRGNLTKIQRQKIVALVTIEVHARDVIEKMIKSGCGDVTAFEWLSQLRLYWDKVCKKQYH